MDSFKLKGTKGEKTPDGILLDECLFHMNFLFLTQECPYSKVLKRML